jgi:hypothetical protein
MKNENSNSKNSEPVSLNPLTFEEALEALLKIPPVENKSIAPKKAKSKKKQQKQ